MVLTNFPKGKGNEIQIKLGKKCSCEE
jgi:hypothetical protein